MEIRRKERLGRLKKLADSVNEGNTVEEALGDKTTMCVYICCSSTLIKHAKNSFALYIWCKIEARWKKLNALKNLKRENFPIYSKLIICLHTRPVIIMYAYMYAHNVCLHRVLVVFLYNFGYTVVTTFVPGVSMFTESCTTCLQMKSQGRNPKTSI